MRTYNYNEIITVKSAGREFQRSDKGELIPAGSFRLHKLFTRKIARKEQCVTVHESSTEGVDNRIPIPMRVDPNLGQLVAVLITHGTE